MKKNLLISFPALILCFVALILCPSLTNATPKEHLKSNTFNVFKGSGLVLDREVTISANLLNSLPTDSVKKSPSNAYDQGVEDAKKYHKRAFGNGALGFLFGPIGVIGVALGRPKKPSALFVSDQALLKNESYLAGYKKKAKAKNITNAAIGWAAWIGFAFATGVY